MAIKLLQVMSWFLGDKLPKTLLNIMILSVTIFGTIWTIVDAMGYQGSPKIVAVLFVIIILVIGTISGILWGLRWALLYPAIKSYVRDNLFGKDIKENTILFSSGTGGAIALGMVSKAVQEIGYPSPKTLLVDITYKENGTAEVGNLLPADFNLSGFSVIFITSYIGTGSALHTTLNRLKIENAPVFSIVVSEAAKDRENIKHYLITGSRKIIPWEKSVSPKV